MGLMQKKSGSVISTPSNATENAHLSLTDGALDTLGVAIRIMGEESFPLENERDANQFALLCAAFAGHVENGAAVPDFDIELSENGKREWKVVQRFLVDRRRTEKKFVSGRLSGYRDIVGELVASLREVGLRDQTTQANVVESLTRVQETIEKEGFGENELPKIKTALAAAITTVSETFAEQKKSYEHQLQDLNDRMSNLREDLVAVREEMKRDSLTQAFNRGAFDSAIKQSINMHFFSRQPVCLLFIDLDEFKLVNDGYGHSVGDAALQAVAEKLARAFIRKNDLVARYGGDEFAVILGDTKAEDVVMLVDRFLNAVRDIAIDADGELVNISCSVGFTEVSEEDTVETFVNRADKALFEAKARGRDRSVCLYA